MNSPDEIQNTPEVQNPEVRDGIVDRLRKHGWLEVTQDPICTTGGMALKKSDQYLRIRPNDGSPSGWDIEIIPPSLSEKVRSVLKSILSLKNNKTDNPIQMLQEENELNLTRQYPRGKNNSVQIYSIDSPQTHSQLRAA